MPTPSFERFQELAMHGNVVPIAQRVLADLLTPVSAFLRISSGNRDGFLFESIEGGAKIARYSFLGARPRERVSFDGEQITIHSAGETRVVKQDIFDYLGDELAARNFVKDSDLPRFCGGYVGYFGYDVVRQIEKLPEIHPGKTHTPVVSLGLYDTILAFDHVRQQLLIIANAYLTPGCRLKSVYEETIDRIASVRQSLAAPLKLHTHVSNGHAYVESNFSENQFCDSVRRAKEYIGSGDIFQVVLSQKFSRQIEVPPIDIYRALRVINPSPYLYFFRQDKHTTVGASPELLVRVENGEVVVRPIAGTRPRGKSEADDQRLAVELLSDEKELAEHAMLVDLGRNDVGRVSEYGSVRISERMIIEKYSHVMHIVSEVRGRLKSGMNAVDAFKACFPAGTVSGAPKIRAMEIIEELEPERRGLYSGAMGYLDFSGNLDTCITIRTLEVIDGVAHFQAGAGIVADSVPEKEYQETIHKSNALRAAIAMAEGGLQSV